MPSPVPVPLPPLDAAGRASFEHDGRWFAVFSVDGAPVVTDNACPHKSGQLSEGLVRDGAIVCPFHFYAFDLVSGRCRTTELYGIRLYPVETHEGHLVALIPPLVKRSWSELLRAHAREGQGE